VIVRLNSCEFSYFNGPRLLAAEMLHSVALRGDGDEMPQQLRRNLERLKPGFQVTETGSSDFLTAFWMEPELLRVQLRWSAVLKVPDDTLTS
jgi:hypothetical protein